jgi:uncharacterized protein
MGRKTLPLTEMAGSNYVPRLTDALLEQLLAGVSAVLLAGPRASGKTTTARRHVATVVQLDRAIEAGPVAADPDTVLATLPEPILLDEWQDVPQVLSAGKRLVDEDSGPGRFLLTGSARSDALAGSWPATGRILRLTQWGLCRRELDGDVAADSFFDTVFGGGLASLRPPPAPPDIRAYVDYALAGGFPRVALQSADLLRRRWLASYVDHLVTRDGPLLGEQRDPRRLRRYLQALAANSAGIVDHKTVYSAAGITRDTALAYDALLELLMVADQVPAWSTNHLKRLARAPKRFLTDPALLGPLLGVDQAAAFRDGDVLGRLIETFVLAQLRPEREVSVIQPEFFHLRDQQGRHEVDVIVEAPDGRLLAIEIKATSAPTRGDARHLCWLRDELGPLFVGGVVFHTGPRAFQLDADIHALPISVLWGRVE